MESITSEEIVTQADVYLVDGCWQHVILLGESQLGHLCVAKGLCGPLREAPEIEASVDEAIAALEEAIVQMKRVTWEALEVQK